MKKGISPLISWVLLIGFGVAMALFISNWIIDQVSNTDINEDTSIYCDQVDLRIDSVCLPSNTEVRLDLSNDGVYSIRRLTFERTTTDLAKGTCISLLQSSIIEPGAVALGMLFTVTAETGSGIGQYSNVKDVECNTLNPTGPVLDTDHLLTEIRIVPWIKIGEDTFACSEKEIVLNNLDYDLNTDCS